MRSSRHLRTEISLRNLIERLQLETGDSEDEWGRLARRRNLRELNDARNEFGIHRRGAGLDIRRSGHF